MAGACDVADEDSTVAAEVRLGELPATMAVDVKEPNVVWLNEQRPTLATFLGSFFWRSGEIADAWLSGEGEIVDTFEQFLRKVEEVGA